MLDNEFKQSNTMTQEEKLALYNEAKEAYYNGNPIMGDVEFDSLETELALENKSRIGTVRNPKYTEKHPFIMGSLSKIQIHEDKQGNIDWNSYHSELQKYINGAKAIVSPKYDGCSFEIVLKEKDGNFIVDSISGRGDGYYGKDLKPFLNDYAEEICYSFNLKCALLDTVVLRGEIVVDTELFDSKYNKLFVNPRSFVAGTIGCDYDDNNEELKNRIKDLDIVIYYIAAKYLDEDKFREYDFFDFTEIIPTFYLPDVFGYYLIDFTPKSLEEIYNRFDSYRKNECHYNMDGFVIKPIAKYRRPNFELPRPEDCVAIKFIPMVAETEVTSIEWNLGKSGEYIPNIRFKPVTMDGKQVSKANGFNYGYCIQNNIVPGKKLTISLAGDIIPYIYKINPEIVENKLEIPENVEIVDDIHLMAKKSEYEKENDALYFSILALNIPGMGPELAKKVVEAERTKRTNDEILVDFLNIEATSSEFPTNVLYLTPNDLKEDIEGKNGSKIASAYKKMIGMLSLKDIILTCQFNQCGGRAAEECSKQLISGNGDFTSMNRVGWNWVMDENSKEYQKLMSILAAIKRPISSFRSESSNEVDERIPIIMTGEPTTAETKKDFLNKHPEYRETGSWKEVKIVFTNDLNSNTGKMKKAREKGIEIRVY